MKYLFGLSIPLAFMVLAVAIHNQPYRPDFNHTFNSFGCLGVMCKSFNSTIMKGN